MKMVTFVWVWVGVLVVVVIGAAIREDYNRREQRIDALAAEFSSAFRKMSFESYNLALQSKTAILQLQKKCKVEKPATIDIKTSWNLEEWRGNP